MNCPICNIPLVMSEKQGIEIDYCPKCRGIWLDRGELEKIIERSMKEDQTTSYNPNYKGFDDDDHYENRDKHYDKGHHYGRKKSWWMEIFD